MRISTLGYKLGLAALVSVAFYSCKKSNGINNNNVLETPYGVYFADTAGTLYNTNDALATSIIFPPDGYPNRAITISGNNLLFVKQSAYISTNNGTNFNHSYDTVTQIPTGIVAVNGLPITLNYTAIINLNDQNRLYLVSAAPSPKLTVGVVYSESNGAAMSWVQDTLIDTSTVHFNASITSFTRLKNNTLLGYDAIHNRNFSKSDAGSKWIEQTDTAIVNPNYKLPFGFFTMGHINNTAVAIDNSGSNGAWHSDDNGKTWTQYLGLPTGIPLLCTASPFDQFLLVGTDSAGIYRLNVNTNVFAAVNNGLDNYTVVRGAVAKENDYKNGTMQQFVYLATNKGLYQSVDGGQNWILMKQGNFVTIY